MIPVVLFTDFVTGLEGYFARALGFALLTLGLIVVALSGAIPLITDVDGRCCLICALI